MSAGDRPRRVLSVQSHVAFGYVGGKAAAFPLQCLGYDVDIVNTVNFSNHSGYGPGRFGGTRTTRDELAALFGHMRENGLFMNERLLTGYIPGAEALQAVKEMAEELKQRNPELIYLLDPVLGDAGRLYVAADVIPIYRAMLPLSTIITPNWFEIEVLTGVKLEDVASTKRALRVLHDEHHVPHVVISSMPAHAAAWAGFPPAARPASADAASDALLACLCSSTGGPVHAASVPLIPGYFSGVGDLFSALVLAHFAPRAGAPALAAAAGAALAKTHAVLARTHAYFQALPADERSETDEEADAADPARRVARMRARELRLIQSRDILGEPDAGAGVMVPWDDFWTERG